MEKSFLLSQKHVHVCMCRTPSSPMQSHTHTQRSRASTKSQAGLKITPKDTERLQDSTFTVGTKPEGSKLWQLQVEHSKNPFFSHCLRGFFYLSKPHFNHYKQFKLKFSHFQKQICVICVVVNRSVPAGLHTSSVIFLDKLYYIRFPGEMSKHPVRQRKRKSVQETLHDLVVEVLTRTCSSKKAGEDPTTE